MNWVLQEGRKWYNSIWHLSRDTNYLQVKRVTAVHEIIELKLFPLCYPPLAVAWNRYHVKWAGCHGIYIVTYSSCIEQIQKQLTILVKMLIICLILASCAENCVTAISGWKVCFAAPIRTSEYENGRFAGVSQALRNVFTLQSWYWSKGVVPPSLMDGM